MGALLGLVLTAKIRSGDQGQSSAPVQGTFGSGSEIARAATVEDVAAPRREATRVEALSSSPRVLACIRSDSSLVPNSCKEGALQVTTGKGDYSENTRSTQADELPCLADASLFESGPRRCA